MDDGPRASVRALVVAAGLLVLMGAGCMASSVQKNATSTANASNTTVAPSSTPVTFFDGIRNARACNLTIDNLKTLIPMEPDLTPLQSLLTEKSKDGWELTQLCLDQDVWVVGERDPIYTIYFSITQYLGGNEGGVTTSVKSSIGVWSLWGASSGIHLSSPVSIKDVGGIEGFTSLDLEKHYGESAQVIPTVHAHLDFPGEADSRREGYTFGPNDSQPRKTFSCSRTIDVKKTETIISDTCKNKID